MITSFGAPEQYALRAGQCEEQSARATGRRLQELWAEEAALWRALDAERTQILALVEAIRSAAQAEG